MFSDPPRRTGSGGIPQGSSPVIGRRSRLLNTLGLKVTRTGAHGENNGGGSGGYFGTGYFGTVKRPRLTPQMVAQVWRAF